MLKNPRAFKAGSCQILLLVAGACVEVTQLSHLLDKMLRANFHYDYCRKLGQLDIAEIMVVHDGVTKYLSACQRRGMRMGNIKPAVLQVELGWVEDFVAPLK